MMSFRRSSLYRRFRRTRIFLDVLRPVYSRRILLNWWALGRPAPPPHDIKINAILYLADRIGARNFVETGSYLGDTVRALRGRFDRIDSIELAPELAEPLQVEFAGDPTVRIILGDSGAELCRLLPELSGPTVFWLDAHYSGGPTLGDGVVPIFAEVDAISSSCSASHAIVIDDMKDFTGKNGYPTQEELKKRVGNLGYEVHIFNNMMHTTRTAFTTV